jgi:hypothetical protein
MKRQPAQGVLLILLSVLGLPSAALANQVDGVAFPSTPFMPPHGFEWVPLLFVGLFIVVNTYLLRRNWAMSSRRAALITTGVGVAVAVLAITVIPLHYWWYIRDMRWGGHPLLGWNWTHAFPEFLGMNALTLVLVILGSFCLAYYHPHRKSPGIPRVLIAGVIIAVLYGIIAVVPEIMLQWRNSLFVLYGLLLLLLATAGETATDTWGKRIFVFIGANGIIYLLCLIPFLASGAMAHGQGPRQQCRSQFSWGVGSALIAYTRAHQGRLPDGRTIERVFKELEPYYAETSMGMGGYGPISDPLICRAGEWYDRHPRRYTWNASLAGKSIDELRTLPQAMLITCPYHKRHYINTTEMIEAYDDPEASTFSR